MVPEFDGGRYRLQEQLNPEGAAWLAEDLEDPGRQVVIKILPESTDAIAARHLAQSLAELRRPGLSVPVDEGELPDGRPFLVFPYAEGHSLREILNTSGPFSFRRAANVLQQIGDALGRLHERGLVHGGISPEHVILNHTRGQDAVTLLGVGVFGLTRETSTSPAYLAPEQLAGEATVKSDTFSVGALAAEMLTGRRAFRYGSLAELHLSQRRGIPRGAFRKLRSKIPPRVEDELRRALSWDPAQRPPDVTTFTNRLAEYLGGKAQLPRRRLALLGVLGLAVIATGVRNCRRRWGY